MKPHTNVHLLDQWEINDALKIFNIKPECIAGSNENDYLSTLDVLQIFMKYLNNVSYSLSRFIIIAQADHAFRVKYIMHQLGFKDNIKFGPIKPDQGWINFACLSLGYNINSTQPWTRKR